MMEGPKGYVEFAVKDSDVVPNPLEEHTANSRWQTCNCLTCQRKRKMMDSLPGEKIDWTQFKKSA